MAETRSDERLLVVEGLRKRYQLDAGLLARIFGRGRSLTAVDGVSFSVRRTETLGIVGESGCGKSTTGLALLQLIPPVEGDVRYDGRSIVGLPHESNRQLRRHMQMILQNPYSSLNPRLRLGEIVAEPVSALDVSVQAQILNLLLELKEEFELTYVFISHDLSVVRYVSDRIAVMYLGEIVEMGPAHDVHDRPPHPCTRALMSAVPEPDPHRDRRRIVLGGGVPSPVNPPAGCRFHPRCPLAVERCRHEKPWLRDVGGREVMCHLV